MRILQIIKTRKNYCFYVAMFFSVIAPTLIFVLLYLLLHFGFNFGFQFNPPKNMIFENWAMLSIFYLSISALLIFGFVIFLGRKSAHYLPVAFFTAIARAITLRPVQDSWTNLGPIIFSPLSGWNNFVWTVYTFNDYFFTFLFLLFTPIVVYFGISLMYKSNQNLFKKLIPKYVLGLILLGVGSYLVWCFANKLFSYFIYGLQLSSDIWLYLFPVGFLLTLFGFKLTFKVRS